MQWYLGQLNAHVDVEHRLGNGAEEVAAQHEHILGRGKLELELLCFAFADGHSLDQRRVLGRLPRHLQEEEFCA
jgi:hypothetical protein